MVSQHYINVSWLSTLLNDGLSGYMQSPKSKRSIGRCRPFLILTRPVQCTVCVTPDLSGAPPRQLAIAALIDSLRHYRVLVHRRTGPVPACQIAIGTSHCRSLSIWPASCRCITGLVQCGRLGIAVEYISEYSVQHATSAVPSWFNTPIAQGFSALPDWSSAPRNNPVLNTSSFFTLGFSCLVSGTFHDIDKSSMSLSMSSLRC